ncbi:MAG: hypothetical protein J2P27_16455 [Actinobacteria bacterium]|nr:hypothetical protein [Actinomycetota bacterium]
MDSIQHEYVAMPGGAVRRVYSIDQADGSVVLGDYQAWITRRAARCSCGKVCCGSGRTCGAPECIARLAADQDH